MYSFKDLKRRVKHIYESYKIIIWNRASHENTRNSRHLGISSFSLCESTKQVENCFLPKKCTVNNMSTVSQKDIHCSKFTRESDGSAKPCKLNCSRISRDISMSWYQYNANSVSLREFIQMCTRLIHSFGVQHQCRVPWWLFGCQIVL